MKKAMGMTVLGFCWLGIAHGEEWTKTWKVEARPEVRVTSGDAAVYVEVGNDREISALVRTRGIGIGQGAGVKISEHQVGNRVELEVRNPSSHWGFGMRSIEVRLRVPQQTMTDVHTGDGSVHVMGVHGTVRLDTGDGSVHGEDLDGSLDAHSGDGSVHVKGRFDNLKLRTSDGSVDVQALEGSRLNTGWHIESGDGSVRVTVPRNLAADVQLQTGDGSIHSDLPLTVQGTPREHDLAGKLNGGGAFLEVRTGDGSITIGTN